MTEISIRSMIVAPPNHVLLQFDLSQAETWVVAHLANEQNMKHFLLTSDIHTETASLIFKTPFGDVTKIQRFLGKKGNHQLSYRSSYYRLVQSINAESDKPPFITVSNKEGKFVYDGWHQIYNLKTWWTDIERQLSDNARMLITPYRRKRTFFEQWGQELFKEATAYVPQSTVADHLNGAIQPELSIPGGLLEVYKRFARTKAVTIINQSHDSFVCEVPKDSVRSIALEIYSLVRRPLIISGEEFTIPVDCEVGERFGELEKMKMGN